MTGVPAGCAGNGGGETGNGEYLVRPVASGTQVFYGDEAAADANGGSEGDDSDGSDDDEPDGNGSDGTGNSENGTTRPED